MIMSGLHASGEMAALVRDFDWASTALGPVEDWPRSLRIAADICLHSRFPMFVWWGPELINIYNDSYVPMLGTRHPAALGRPAKDTWADIWDVVGPQAQAVMQHGKATWNERVPLMMKRQGHTEETYFTWSYSPIYDDSGRIGGVFCACVEETSRVFTERERDRLLKENDAERLRLAAAFAQSPSFLAIMRGPYHVFEYVNERYQRLIGEREVIGRRVRDALPEVEGQGFFEILDKVYATGEPFFGKDMRVYIRRPGESAPEETFVDFIYQPMRASTGEVAGILAHGVDVTERKKAEVRDRFMLALEDALRPLTEPAEITATGVRLLGDYLEADRCAYADVEPDGDTFNLMGDYNRNVPSIVGRYRFSDFSAEVFESLRAGRSYVVRDVDTHQPPIGDLSFYRKTLIRAVICVPLLKAGRLVAAMAVHQASPRNWSEADVELLSHVASRCWESIERARVQRTLRKSEADFRQLADAMPQIVFSAGPDGNVDYFNRQWYEYTGLADGQIGYDSWKQVHTEDGLQRSLEAWPRAMTTGEPYEIEYALRRHDGEYRWHLGRALPIRDENGRIVRWFGTNTDIHDRKQTEQALATSLDAEQRARSEAELASRMKDEFLANLIHELRTPLTAILGWSHIMRRENVSPQQLANGADVIERNARAQAQIIEDLLDMSAIISGKVRLNMSEHVDLGAVITAAIETTRAAADAKRIAIRVHIEAADRLHLNADASRLQQVIWNLLSNAIKFTPAGGRVHVNAVRMRDTVEISVADTGEGIESDFLPYVFDRFRQADASTTRRHGGLGLGLSIVKQLVELHGGTVGVFSEGENRGTTFSVTLPAESRFAQTDTSVTKRRHADIESAGKESDRIRGVRILVVDDDADARELLRRLLEDCGAQVALSDSSADAIEIIRKGQLDLVVSDIGMPGEDGYTLIRRVRALPAEEGGKVPALALTAYARAEDRVKAIRAGYQMHVPKPVDPAELIAMVASMSDSR